MRVLHAVASLAPRHGGPTTAVLEMVRAQRDIGIDARILSSNDDEGQWLPVPTNQWIDYQGLPTYFLPRIKARQHTLIGFTFTPGYGRWIRNHGKEYDFIHVHTVFSHPANSAMHACRRLKIPYCVRPLGQLCAWSLQQRSFVKKTQLSLFGRRNIDSANFIHCTAEMEAQEVAECGFASPCRVLPHGVQAPPLTPLNQKTSNAFFRSQQSRPQLVFFSRIHPKKGLELLLEALPHVQQECDLTIIGSGMPDYVAQLKECARQHSVERVRWLGHLDGEDKWQALLAADLFILPSKSENFGIAVLEAAACGLPVIVSDQVAVHDSVVKLGLGIAFPRSIEQLAATIDRALLSFDYTEKGRSERRRIVETHFGWQTAAQRLAAAYEASILTS